MVVHAQLAVLHRPGSGSLLDSGSTTYSMVHGWVGTDPWLLVGGFIAALLTLLSPRLRPFGCALLLQVVVLIHGGYLPFFYVTAVVPFAAVSSRGRRTRSGRRPCPGWAGWRLASAHAPSGTRPISAGRWSPLAALTFAAYVLPTWIGYLSPNSRCPGQRPVPGGGRLG